MKQKSGPDKAPAEQVLKDIRRQTRRQYSAEEKIRIVLEGLRGEESISELCRREGIAASMYYGWSKEFLEAGKRRLAGDTARAATSAMVEGLAVIGPDGRFVFTNRAVEAFLDVFGVAVGVGEQVLELDQAILTAFAFVEHFTAAVDAFGTVFTSHTASPCRILFGTVVYAT